MFLQEIALEMDVLPAAGRLGNGLDRIATGGCYMVIFLSFDGNITGVTRRSAVKGMITVISETIKKAIPLSSMQHQRGGSAGDGKRLYTRQNLTEKGVLHGQRPEGTNRQH